MFAKETLLWFYALSGSGLFLIQFVLYFVGADADDVDDGHQFKWMSKQAVTGFLMMFGWVGLACKKEFGFGPFASALIAMAAGAFAMFVCGSIFKAARKLRSTGTVFRLMDEKTLVVTPIK